MRIVGIPENAGKQDLGGFLLRLLAKELDLDVDEGFELECAHRVSSK